MGKRKRLFILVEVSAPADIPARLARREVRERIRDVRNWSWETADVKLIGLKATRAPRHG